MDRKSQILDAAIELFAMQGYDNTSIAAVCSQAQVSKGAVFHHFKNKDELLREVFLRMAQIIGEVGEASSANQQSQSAGEQLRSLLEQIFESMALPQHRRYYQFDFQVLCQPAMRAQLQDLLDRRYQMMLDSFHSILSELPQADVEIDSHMLIAEIDGIAMNYLFAGDDYPLARIKDRFIQKNLLLFGCDSHGNLIN